MNSIFSFAAEARSLGLCEKRAALIATNIANANTPGYQARDINFQEAMQQANAVTHSVPVHAGDIPLTSEQQSAQLYYRIPMQYKMDHNTVDDEMERKNFMDNALRYQASIGLVQNKASQLIKAFRGE